MLGLGVRLVSVDRRGVFAAHYVLEYFNAFSVCLSNYLEDLALLFVKHLQWVTGALNHLQNLIEFLLTNLLLEEVLEKLGSVGGHRKLRVEKEVF